MGFFGMGAPEILVIMIVALIIFGPGKLPEIGAQVGKTVRDFRRATRDLTSDFEASMNDVQSTMGEMKQTMADVQRETQELANTIPASIEGRDTGASPSASSTSAAANAIGTSTTVTTGDTSTTPVEATTAPRPPIAVTPRQAATSATKDDPFADLVELDDEPMATGKAPSASQG